MPRLLASALVLLLAAPSAAQHNARYRLSGGTTQTEIAGTHGASFTATGGASHSILHSLSVWQTDGLPCQVEGGFWHAPDGFPTVGASPQQSTDQITTSYYRDEPTPLLDCGTPRSKRTAAASFPQPGGTTLTLWGHYGAAAVHGVRVCTGPAGDAVRGVRVLVSHLNAAGSGEVERSASFAEEFARPTCQRWSPARRCPIGQVATSVKGYYSGDTLVGLSLGCRRVEMTELDGSPIGPTLRRN